MLNQVVLTGNLGRDPEVRYSATGTAVTTFSMCFKAPKGKDVWINVVLFGKLAESASQHLSKGSRIGIIGVLDENSWEDQNGNTRRNFQIIGNSIEYIKTNKKSETEDSGTYTKNNENSFRDNLEDDSIPF